MPKRSKGMDDHHFCLHITHIHGKEGEIHKKLIQRNERYTKTCPKEWKIQKERKDTQKEGTNKRKTLTCASNETRRKEINTNTEKTKTDEKHIRWFSFELIFKNIQDTNETLETRKHPSCILSNISKSGSISIFVYEEISFQKFKDD